MDLKSLRDKKIAILGIGVEGLSLAKFLYEYKISNITICDQKSSKELRENLKKIPGNPKLILGKDYLKNLENFDLCFRSPGISTNLPEIQKVQDEVEFSSLTNLFFELCPGKIIGVTGTKGKGTTSTLLYEIFKSEGKKVFLAGNIGKPALDLLEKIDQDSWVIYELSSFQLEDIKASPHIAIFLNIFVDHLDHHRDFEEYFLAKSRIFHYQDRRDFAIINQKFQNKLRKIKIQAEKLFFGEESGGEAQIFQKSIKINFMREESLFSLEKIKLLGKHNYYNIAAAVFVAKIIKIKNQNIQKTINQFRALPHRLELVRSFKGIKFYNDSIATIPESTIAAIKSFKNPKILILGGSDKGASFEKLAEKVYRNNVKTVILIGETARKIRNSFSMYKDVKIIEAGDLKIAVKKAVRLAESGDVVLLSPACASFDMFSGYKERGEEFKRIIKKL